MKKSRGWSREEIRTLLLFWLFSSAYSLLTGVLIAALLTDWPEFLHPPQSIGP